jgi:hypothetical protein
LEKPPLWIPQMTGPVPSQAWTPPAAAMASDRLFLLSLLVVAGNSLLGDDAVTAAWYLVIHVRCSMAAIERANFSMIARASPTDFRVKLPIT